MILLLGMPPLISASICLNTNFADCLMPSTSLSCNTDRSVPLPASTAQSHLLQVVQRGDVEPARHPEAEVESDGDDWGCGTDDLQMVGSDGVQQAGPAVPGVAQPVQEDHRGRLLDPGLQNHRLEGGSHHGQPG